MTDGVELLMLPAPAAMDSYTARRRNPRGCVLAVGSVTIHHKVFAVLRWRVSVRWYVCSAWVESSPILGMISVHRAAGRRNHQHPATRHGTHSLRRVEFGEHHFLRRLYEHYLVLRRGLYVPEYRVS